jgi:hypothetical protein
MQLRGRMYKLLHRTYASYISLKLVFAHESSVWISPFLSAIILARTQTTKMLFTSIQLVKYKLKAGLATYHFLYLNNCILNFILPSA